MHLVGRKHIISLEVKPVVAGQEKPSGTYSQGGATEKKPRDLHTLVNNL